MHWLTVHRVVCKIGRWRLQSQYWQGGVALADCWNMSLVCADHLPFFVAEERIRKLVVEGGKGQGYSWGDEGSWRRGCGWKKGEEGSSLKWDAGDWIPSNSTIPFNSGWLCSVPLFGCFTEIICILGSVLYQVQTYHEKYVNLLIQFSSSF